MRLLGFLKDLLLRGLLYTMVTGTAIWILAFAVGIYRYHYVGNAPDHILWLPAQHMPWAQALSKSAYIASVAAVIMLAIGMALTLTMNAIGGLLLGIAAVINKTRHYDTLKKHTH